MKVLIGLATALLVFLAGLVDTPAAHAAPYPHTITTYCHSKAVKNPISRDTRPRFRFWITTNGNGRPTTIVHIRIVNRKTHQLVRKANRWYNEPVETWRFKKLKPGRYKFKFHTATGPVSVYKNCSTASRLRVTR
jgi:hypothetical protein